MAKSPASSTAPPAIVALVEQFAEHRDTYHRTGYNETQLRHDYLNPFFEALGWDIHNRAGHAEAYRDVILEHSMRVEESARAPDYLFRISQTAKFFVEAKKPAVDIRSDIGPAFQLRRYAWTAKLPLSILTDFEEFAVYDCRIKPDKNDKASTARVMFLSFEEYVDRWDEIAGIFSREAITKGSFDKYAESNKKKRGTAEVDAAFLEEIESWREALAKNLSLRNESLTDRELNVAVRRIIDRIIFLRMCEGRGIEDYGRLQSLLNGERVYPGLVELFLQADAKYNSGLFYFEQEKGRDEPDELTPGLAIDDKVLKEIVRRLYYPESPYEFAAMPADILGQVYEQFLGKVIRLTPGHRAKIEEKPEVRKAGGVYYTPTYIVDYIVENTVGKLVEGKTPQQIGGLTAMYKQSKTARPLTVLDPACGSGSFLIVAYQFLLDWYLKQYTETDDPKKHSRGANPRIYQIATGDWRLTTSERKRILLAHIYGVDIDSQAVEVTKLSLLLKALEGETKESIALMLFHKERALPDLARNIRCGNSLIGSDFYENQQRQLFDEEERYRINAFDWQGELGFPEIFRGENPGFDAVIGNPPYLFITEVPEEMREYYQNRYSTVEYRFDLYGAFVEKSLRELLQTEGRFGFIIPHTLLSNDSFRKLRVLLATESRLFQILDFGPGVFKNAKNETMLLFFEKHSPSSKSRIRVKRAVPKFWPELVEDFEAPQDSWAKSNGSAWLVHVNGRQQSLIARMSAISTSLREFCTSNQGVRTGDNDQYLANEKRGSKWHRAAGGKQIGRYIPIPDELYVYYVPSELDAPRRRELFTTTEKIIIQEIRNISLSRRLVATFDVEQVFGLQSTNVINSKESSPVDLRYILGVLNSNPVNVYFRYRFPGNNHIPSNQLLSIPIPNPDSRKLHDRIVTLVQQMLDLHARVAKVRTDHERTVLQRQIEHTDRQIDALVYELYGLTPEEIALVEEATK